jgi:hypothetical protein
MNMLTSFSRRVLVVQRLFNSCTRTLLNSKSFATVNATYCFKNMIELMQCQMSCNSAGNFALWQDWNVNVLRVYPILT